MRSVRLDPTLESRLTEAAKITGQPVSSIIRDAIEERCDAILGDRLIHRMQDLIGVVCTKGGRARRTGEAFRRALQKGRARRA